MNNAAAIKKATWSVISKLCAGKCRVGIREVALAVEELTEATLDEIHAAVLGLQRDGKLGFYPSDDPQDRDVKQHGFAYHLGGTSEPRVWIWPCVR